MKLEVTKSWCEQMAALEAGHDVTVGGEFRQEVVQGCSKYRYGIAILDGTKLFDAYILIDDAPIEDVEADARRVYEQMCRSLNFKVIVVRLQ